MPVDLNTPINQKNQDVINAFSKAFGSEFWGVVERCGLTIIGLPKSNWQLQYVGPTIAELTALNDDEKRRLAQALFGSERLMWEYQALRSLHGPANPGGGWVAEAYEVVRQIRPQAIKVLAPDIQPQEITNRRAINPNLFFMARLFNGQLHEKRSGGRPEEAGRWFANEVADPGDGNNPLKTRWETTDVATRLSQPIPV